MRCWLLALSLLPALAGCGGCRGATSTTVDAGIDAAVDASVVLAPWKATIVARSVSGEMELVELDDGLILASGATLFAVAADGGLQRIGTPADAVPLLLEGDDELSGYDSSPFSFGPDSVSGTAASPVVRTSDTTAFQWNGKAWTKAAAVDPHRPNHFESDEPGKAALPTGYDWTKRHTTKSSILWLGRKPQGSVDEVALIGKDQRAQLVPLPVESDAGVRYRTCDFIPSANERTYLSCTVATGSDDYKHAFFVIDGDRAAAYVMPESAKNGYPRAIDAEGSLWYVERGGLRIARIASNGTEEHFEAPPAPAGLTAPSYQSPKIDIATAGDNSGAIRHWMATTIGDRAAPGAIGWIHAIAPRPSGEVWLLARELGGANEPGRGPPGSVLIRYARGGTTATPMLIRSSTDERNAIQHARAIRTWAGHCNSLFVPFPRARRDAGGEPDAFYAEHKAAIDQAVAKSDRKGGKTAAPLDVAVVDGRLDGRAVGGILFIRSDPDGDEKRMETAVRRIAEIATPDPASPAVVTCSAPELERVVARLRIASPDLY